MVNRRPSLRTRQSHLTALKYPPQSRSPTISADSSPLQSWADTILPWETRLLSREIKWNSLTSAVTFTTDQVTKRISSCSNTRAFGLEKFSNLPPKASWIQRNCYTSLHSSTTLSHLVGFGSHPLSSQS